MKKIIFVVLIVFVVVACVPWIWLESTYGITNIPHYDLTMWIFMELYFIIAVLGFLAVLLIGIRVNGEEEPELRKNKKARRKLEKSIEVEPSTEEEEAPAELQEDAVEDGSYTDPTVEYPAEWDEEIFE